jgi:hypothetical protein
LEQEKTNQGRGRRRRVVAVVLVLCVLVGIGVVAFWPGEREPQYNGKKLSEWLEIHHAGQLGTLGPDESRAQAETAITHIGTNALPWLVKWIKCERRELPRWRIILFKTACILHVKGTQVWTAPDGSKFYTAGKSMTTGLLRDRDSVLAEYAERGFRLLGTQAVPAIPDLLNLWQDAKALGPTIRIANAIASVPDPVYHLSEMLTNQMSGVHLSGARGLYSLSQLKRQYPGIDPRGGVVALIQATGDPDIRVREYVTNALRAIAPEVLTNGANEVNH